MDFGLMSVRRAIGRRIFSSLRMVPHTRLAFPNTPHTARLVECVRLREYLAHLWPQPDVGGPDSGMSRGLTDPPSRRIPAWHPSCPPPPPLGPDVCAPHIPIMPPLRPRHIPAHLLRRASESRPPATGSEDYDV